VSHYVQQRDGSYSPWNVFRLERTKMLNMYSPTTSKCSLTSVPFPSHQTQASQQKPFNAPLPPYHLQPNSPSANPDPSPSPHVLTHQSPDTNIIPVFTTIFTTHERCTLSNTPDADIHFAPAVARRWSLRRVAARPDRLELSDFIVSPGKGVVESSNMGAWSSRSSLSSVSVLPLEEVPSRKATCRASMCTFGTN